MTFDLLPIFTMRLFIHTYLSSMRLLPLVTASLILISLLSSFSLQATQSNEKAQKQNRTKLSDIQKAISKQESNIFDANKQRSGLEKQLKTDDLAIAKVAKAINEIEQDLSSTQTKISKLAAEKERLAIAKKKQEILLAQQLRSAYTTGQHDYLKLLLNQDQSEKIQRTISYYQ